ncbi:hypothetical protein QC763_106320 [Podospora pseudopauciseta]|uniref:Uncharacterized protein n=2 Tax=Podospora TaxID=5144 RepID=A0ABR0HY20_9PEZI|nr:hypothetical protein QC763_106320 [Podospora pseudopauciseta]KAK4681316.1 hypothetical protein QC764_106320 [Podospora pseudoanserina]
MPPQLRIPIFVTLPVGQDESRRLLSRKTREQPSKEAQIVGAVLGGIFALIIIYFCTRSLWRKCLGPRGGKYKPTEREDDSPTTRQINREAQDNLEDALAGAQAQNGTTNNNLAAVDRSTSVRSVMTLPVYRPKATENEQVLGREGERDGIDVVVEMPTAEQEEELREQEMEALYQIRAARRRQLADREERRRLRREAREANDVVAMRELRERGRSVAAINTVEIEELRNEHERLKETRARAVSTVAYGDLGVARADGTRIRANSTDSERIGLLSDAASIGASTQPESLLLRRDRSHSAATLSIDTTNRPNTPSLTTGGSAYSLNSAGLTSAGLPSAGLPSAGLSTRSRANSGANTPRVPSAMATPRAGSSPEMIDTADLADFGMPPPDYDEVSLDDITPGHSRRNSGVSALSGRNSPFNEPPPDYPGPGPARARSNRLSAAIQDLAAQAQEDQEPTGRPGLRLSQVPQIVIEPSSARP